MLRNMRLVAAALLAFALPAFAQGPVILMGIDAEDGNGVGSAHGGKTPYIDVIGNGILPNVNNGGSGLLVIGGGKNVNDDVTVFWNAIGTGVSESVTFVNGAAAIGAQSFAGFAVVAIASSVHQTPGGGLTDAESNALNARSADIATHVNGGGGLFCTSQETLPTPYGYLGSIGSFTFNFPAQYQDVTATAEGLAIGITNTNLDVCCWHDEYLTFPGFLDVLATNNSTGNPSAIGGLEVIIVQGIVLTPLNAINVIGTNHTVTATVADSMGDPVVGTTVTFNVIAGPNTGAMGMDVTDVNGQAFYTYSSPVVGIDTIEGCFTDNAMVVQCDQVTKQWIAACHNYDFETEDDFTTPLVNGQHINTEFGNLVTITSSGPNAGAGIFDSTPGGPNDPSQDRDLLVGSGNILILQTENFPPDGNDIFPRPNDDEDGGTLSFAFDPAVEAMSVRLIDIDAGPANSVVLTDVGGKKRTYAVPANWTGDILLAQPGQGTLDLTALAPQPGFASVATASEDAGFDPVKVVNIDFHMGGSGSIDDLSVCSSDLGLPRASASIRNGHGMNPMNFANASLPILGGTWATNLDCSGMGSGLARLIVRRSPTSLTTLSGELLITGALLHSETRAHSGSTELFTWQVPSDMALLGLHAYAQSIVTSTPSGPRHLKRASLSNAIDLVLGF